MVPLIDVMLVLLVIFIVTAPLLTHAVKLDLPKATLAAPTIQKPEKIEFAIDAAGALLLERRARSAAPRRPRASPRRARSSRSPRSTCAPTRASPTATSPQTLADASKAGLTKVGFVSEPRADPRARRPDGQLVAVGIGEVKRPRPAGKVVGRLSRCAARRLDAALDV